MDVGFLREKYFPPVIFMTAVNLGSQHLEESWLAGFTA